ncbi:unnamed protein product [Thelazia callipaeda]|uniref:Protein kinase domain-containing protein n=1 Tax=Thelazia callipaeda TaxID=103827 RepID=A0A0N5CS63_THECL|nr:unnamed protein product [Thelazia callipaeda]
MLLLIYYYNKLKLNLQDESYMYMVSDLLLGGDLRYHLNQQGRFAEDRSKLYVCEIALALDYLHKEMIVHRDVKPENILLDDEGHAHLTDFNLATRLAPNTCATSFSGTKPYMAPEVLLCSLGYLTGYDYRVDWYSLGICFYEMLMGRRPFDYTTHLSSEQVLYLMSKSLLALPSHWPSDLISFISCMLRFRRTAPVFIPRSDRMNCDPIYELEMHIIGSLEKNYRDQRQKNHTKDEKRMNEISQAFISYNREYQCCANQKVFFTNQIPNLY